ncbi:MAG: hypothetical protein ACRYG8_42615 [Janthinobacterium lividum]
MSSADTSSRRNSAMCLAVFAAAAATTSQRHASSAGLTDPPQGPDRHLSGYNLDVADNTDHMLEPGFRCIRCRKQLAGLLGVR